MNCKLQFFYCTDYIIYLYMHCNFICGLSDVIIKTFSQSPSRIVSYRIFSNRIRCDTIRCGIFTCAQHLTSSQLILAHGTAKKYIGKKQNETIRYYVHRPHHLPRLNAGHCFSRDFARDHTPLSAGRTDEAVEMPFGLGVCALETPLATSTMTAADIGAT